LLDGSGAEDNIVAEELHGNDGAFAARIEIAQFRLRAVRVSTLLLPSIVYDCAFLTRPDVVPNFLCGPVRCSRYPQATLELDEHSPPTWVDAQLVITADSTVPTEREPPLAHFCPAQVSCAGVGT